MVITSAQNAKVKYLKDLFRDKKARSQYGVFVAEGITLVRDIPASAAVREVYVKESEQERLRPLAARWNNEVIVLADRVFDSVSDTVTPSGVVAVVERPKVSPVTGERIGLLAGISDPGNLGAIVRTASAAGIKTLLLLDSADAYSPKAVRASMGGIFHVNIVPTDTENLIGHLNGYQLLSLDMNGNSIYSYQNHGKVAIAVGSESHGIPSAVREISDQILSIPMQEGGVESLNAAVSFAIAAYIIR